MLAAQCIHLNLLLSILTTIPLASPPAVIHSPPTTIPQPRNLDTLSPCQESPTTLHDDILDLNPCLAIKAAVSASPLAHVRPSASNHVLIKDDSIKDDSINLILSPLLIRDILDPQPPPLFEGTFQLPPPRSPPLAPTDLAHGSFSQQASSIASPTASPRSDTFIEETQFSVLSPQLPAKANSSPSDTPIKAIPIQALTPNGTFCVLPVTPQLDSKKSRRRSSRLLNNEEGSNLSARLEKAAKTKSLELAPPKKVKHRLLPSDPLMYLSWISPTKNLRFSPPLRGTVYHRRRSRTYSACKPRT